MAARSSTDSRADGKEPTTHLHSASKVAQRVTGPLSRPLRIISLVPSLTETVAALGLGPHIVGCTSFCTSPKKIGRTARIIGGTKDPETHAIKQLNPTHILANTEENKPPCLEALRLACPNAVLWETQPRTVEDSIHLVHQIAQLFAPWHTPALNIADQWNARVSELRKKIDSAQSSQKKTFLYLIWRNPWMVAGDKTYISSLLKEGGLINTIVTANRPTERYPILDSIETTQWIHVDRVFFSSEPYHFLQRHMNLFCSEFASQRDYSQCVMKVDGKALSWFGTGTEDGLAEVLRILHS